MSYTGDPVTFLSRHQGMAKASDYVGQTKKGAQNLAEKEGLIFRLIRVDKEAFFAYPDDIRNDRVCVEIDNGKVTKARVI